MKRWLGVPLLFLLIACGSVKNMSSDGGGGDDDDDGGGSSASFTLSVDPTSLTLPIASSMTVAVTVDRTGTVGDIALSAPSLPANLSASFSPATLPEGTDSAELTITALGGLAPATGSVMVHASAGSLEQDASVSVTTTTITVSGKVRGNRQNVIVGIIGKPSVMSGAGGVFSFTDVTPPYDLYTVADSGFSASPVPTAFFFEDLTTASPNVDAPSLIFFIATFCPVGTICSSKVSGSRLGAGNNTDPILVGWSKGGSQLSTTGTWTDLVARGFSGSMSNGTLHGLQVTRTAGVPTGYFYGATNTTLDASTETVNIALSALGTTAPMTGTLTVPAGFPTPTITMTQQFQETFLDFPTFSTATINGVIPNIAANGFATGFFATTSVGGATTSRSQPMNGAAADVTFTFLEPAQQTAPVVGATGVTTASTFSWTSPANTIHDVSISNANVSFHVFTSKTSTTIPAIPERALPGGQSFTWTVSDYGGYSSVDAFAGVDQPLPAATAVFAGPPRASTVSASRSFTSAN